MSTFPSCTYCDRYAFFCQDVSSDTPSGVFVVRVLGCVIHGPALMVGRFAFLTYGPVRPLTVDELESPPVGGHYHHVHTYGRVAPPRRVPGIPSYWPRTR